MEVDVETLRKWFVVFNDAYFNGSLPTPEFSVGGASTRLGSCSCTMERRLFRTRMCKPKIRISNYYDISEHKYKSVLLHEMIHLCLFARGVRDTSAHGREFRRLMDEINSYGWDVRVREKEGLPVRGGIVRKRKSRLVVVAELTGGRHFVSVVNPRYKVKLDLMFSTSPTFVWHRWFIADDPYFDRFPAVRSPRGRLVGKDELDKLMPRMRELPSRR